MYYHQGEVPSDSTQMESIVHMLSAKNRNKKLNVYIKEDHKWIAFVVVGIWKGRIMHMWNLFVQYQSIVVKGLEKQSFLKL